jgi:hypothetical protein
MKQLLSILTLALVFSSALAQQKKTEKSSPAKYRITESKYNEVDHTAIDLNRGGFFMFLDLDETGELHLLNLSDESEEYSYGLISKIEQTSSVETADTYASENFEFKWNYFNTYDEKNGYATVSLTKIFKPQGTIFTLTMVLSNLDIIEYSGYVEGTVDFKKLK